jgi:glycosyltransferase involved in cell wall biosynthesis
MKIHNGVISERDLLFVARRWTGRSRHTSVERFLDYFPQAVKVTPENAWKRPYRMLKWIAGRAGQNGYTSISAGLEAAALVQIALRRPHITHFLYADHDYHYLGRAARPVRTRLAGTFFFSIEEFETRMPDKSHLRNLDLVIASGREQMAYLARFVPPERLAYLPLGVDTGFFTPPGDPASRRQRGPRLLQTGVNRRDFDTLREVFCRLKAVYPGLRLDMVGCQAAADLFAATPDVVFHPYLDDETLRHIYQESTLLVLPLLEGGSSNALNEALAAGLPVVASDQPNLRDYADSACVALCPPGDAGAMAAACRFWLDDPERREAASIQARIHIQQYDWGEIRKRLLDLYARHLGMTIQG